MKKIISALLSLTMTVGALAACDNKTTDIGTSSTASGISASTDSSAPEPAAPDESDIPAMPDNENGGIDNSDLPFPENRAGELARAALAESEWPQMDIVETQEFLDALFSADFKTDSCEEFCFMTNVISAQLYKLIVIKPKDGKEDELSAALDAYFDAVKNDPNIAFYPMQEQSANGAVKGKTGDGYLYLIVHENGSEIESAIFQ